MSFWRFTRMPKLKRFVAKVEVLLSKEQVDFLADLVRMGVADSVSGAVRRCINMAKNHLSKGEDKRGD